ncbi:MAG: hypothetical protein GIX03_08085 [Candidatus Eremiobacteraeota bacterium]|nr:hypothetical protein [Candidatus Eremiobacteraeota bacterium]MBC5802946.1 hypothetical protein [Candidatus Eremiobacteraeota bacterium]
MNRLTRSAAITSLATLSVLASSARASADDALSLTRVARQLGFHYSYLPFENAVSLARPGIVVVVRPGDPFFSANERREPVFGMVPEYRQNDVYVSRSFMSEIRGLGQPFPAPSARLVVQRGPVDQGHVSELHLSQIPDAPTITVTGTATPGSRIEVVLRAALSASVPIVILDRATAFSDSSGAFATVVSIAPDHWYASRFIVEASGEGDAAPTIAKIDAMEQNPAARTKADDLDPKP